MRLLILNWRDPLNPKAGGAEIYTHEIAKRLVAKGNKVTLFAAAFPGCLSSEQLDGVDVIREGSRLSVYFKAWQRYKREFRNNFDFVIDQINTVPFFSPLYLKDSGAALIFQMTGEIFTIALPKLVGYIARFFEPFMFKPYRRFNIIVISESIKQELVRGGFIAENILIVEPGLKHEDFGVGPKADRPTVLFMNRIVKYKNVLHLVEAFELVRREVPDAVLMIGGCKGGRYEKVVRARVEKLGLSDSVEYYPFVAQEEKTRILRSAWVHVLPSIKEGWGMSVLEAAACGTPSIAYDVVGLKDAISDNESGILVQYGDINALAAAIMRMLKDPDMRTIFSEKALAISKKFTWEKSAARFLTCIEAFKHAQER